MLSETHAQRAQQQQPYIPARAQWNGQSNPSYQTLTSVNNSNSSRGLSPIQDSPVELATQQSHVNAPTSNRLERSSDYYEDVDPRFAEPVPAHQPLTMPTSLMPGGFAASNPNLLSAPGANHSDPNLPRTNSYDELPEGSRSPAASEASHFTSVSQRPVNPNWRPDMGTPAGQFVPYNGRRPVRQEDVILQANAANPDFALPGMAGRGNGRGRGRGGRGGAGMAPPLPASMTGQGGLTNQSRYPGANAM